MCILKLIKPNTFNLYANINMCTMHAIVNVQMRNRRFDVGSAFGVWCGRLHFLLLPNAHCSILNAHTILSFALVVISH